MKVIDCFTFYNELEMLTYRLNVLNDLVDYFILVEATITHVGKDKPLFYAENQELYSAFKDKIIHVVVDDMPFKNPDISKDEQWRNENFQRVCIARGLEQINLSPEDVIIISDLDEIIDPNTLIKIKSGDIKVTYNALEQDFYYYNLNSLQPEKWLTAKIITYERYINSKMTPQDIRLGHYDYSIPQGGWHLSYFGDSAFIQNKIINFGHQEYNHDKYTDLNNIQKQITGKLDLYHRNRLIYILFKDNTYLPPKCEEYLARFICE